MKRPAKCATTTTAGNISAGIYYGTIGALKEIVKRTQNELFSDVPATVILTGGILYNEDEENTIGNSLKADLAEIVDITEPHLSLLGLHAVYHIHRDRWFSQA